MLVKVFISFIIFVVTINISGFQSQYTYDHSLSNVLLPEDFDLQQISYNPPFNKLNKRAYVRLAGKRALVRLGKRAYVRLGKKSYFPAY